MIQKYDPNPDQVTASERGITEWLHTRKNTAVLVAVAVAPLPFTAVSSIGAALHYYPEEYTTRVATGK